MRLIVLAASTSLLVLAASCGANGESAPASSQAGAPETRPANNPDQQPAFPGQTRAPEVSADVAYEKSPVGCASSPPRARSANRSRACPASMHAARAACWTLSQAPDSARTG